LIVEARAYVAVYLLVIAASTIARSPIALVRA
jgi:hypothetical protein